MGKGLYPFWGLISDLYGTFLHRAKVFSSGKVATGLGPVIGGTVTLHSEGDLPMTWVAQLLSSLLTWVQTQPQRPVSCRESPPGAVVDHVISKRSHTPDRGMSKQLGGDVAPSDAFSGFSS